MKIEEEVKEKVEGDVYCLDKNKKGGSTDVSGVDQFSRLPHTAYDDTCPLINASTRTKSWTRKISSLYCTFVHVLWASKKSNIYTHTRHTPTRLFIDSVCCCGPTLLV